MESIIKIASEQGFAETWVPADIATAPPTQKLIDFIIPANTGTYDLGKCWINVNAEVVPKANANEPANTLNSSALYNNDIIAKTDVQGDKAIMCDLASIVRNADMFCANRGMVESIRRQDTLRQLLFNVENDKAEQHDGNLNLGNFQGRRGPSNSTSQVVQIMGGNTSVAGVVDTSIKASNTSRDLRIPLSDLFGVGSALWNTDVYGATRIHLELDTSRLRIEQLGGSEDTSTFQPAGQNKAYGAIEPLGGAGATLAPMPNGNDLGVSSPLVTQIEYFDYELQMPFYCGQAIEVAFTNTAGAQTGYAQISGIEYNEGTNSTNPPNGSKKVRIYTALSLYNNATGGAENITAISIKALKSDPATGGGVPGDQIRINNAEIVLTQLPSVNGPDGIDYRTYSTEETQGVAGLTSFNKQILVEPNAQNLLVAHCPTGETMPSKAWTSYRMSIDNKDVSGNRDIAYNKPLHRDRIARTFNNRGQNISNFSLNAIQVGAAQLADANQLALYPIYETLPLTQQQKVVNFKLEAAAIQDVIFFKELQKSI